MAELVQLELICCDSHADQGVQVVLHVLDERGTPLKRFSTPGKGAAASDSSGLSAVLAWPSCDCSATSSAQAGEEVQQAAWTAQAADEGETRQRLQQRRRSRLSTSDSGGVRPGLLRRLAQLLEQLADKEQRAEQALLAASDQQLQQWQQQPVSPGAAAGAAALLRGSWVQEDVERLLSLEVEVERLQQALHVLQVEFESRGARAEALTLQLRSAESQAKAAEERACRLAEAVQQLQTECGVLEGAREEAAQQLHEVQARVQELEAERALAQAQGQPKRIVEWRKQLRHLRQENQHLKAQIGAACGSLKALGIPASQVFSQAAMAHAHLASPPDSPAPGPTPPQRQEEEQQLTDRSEGSLPGGSRPASARHRPPVVPRLELGALAAPPPQQQQALGGPAQQQASEWCSSEGCSSEEAVSLEVGAAPLQAQSRHHQLRQRQAQAQLAQAAWAGSGLRRANGGVCPAEQLVSPHLPSALAAHPTPAPAGPEARLPVGPAAAGAQPGGDPLGAVSAADLGAAKCIGDSECSVGGGLAATVEPSVGSSMEGQEALLQAAVAGLAVAKLAQGKKASALLLRPGTDSGGGAEEDSRLGRVAQPQALVKGLPAPQWSHSRAGSGAAVEVQQQQLPLPSAQDGSSCCGGGGGSSGGMIAAWRPPPVPGQRKPVALVRHAHVSLAESSGLGGGPVNPQGTGAQGAKLQGAPTKAQGRPTYAQLPDFQEVQQAYQAVMASEVDKLARWATKLSSKSAIETHPGKVEPVMQGLIQLFKESGVPMPLRRTGPCQYCLPGGAKVVVRLVNGRLMARSGPSNVDVFAWLGKQPVAAVSS